MNKIFYTVITLIVMCMVLTGCSKEGENLSKTPPLVENPLPTGPSSTGEEENTDTPLSQNPPADNSGTDGQDKNSPFLDTNLPIIGSEAGDEDNKENKGNKDKEKKSDSDLVDLTVLSSTMVYAEVYNMMSYPEDYLGKTIKMIGLYYPGYFEETKRTYHFAVIADAAACCSQGIEFMWNGEHTYPDDYPAEGSIIVVTGIFDSYKEGEETYYYVAADEINKK